MSAVLFIYEWRMTKILDVKLITATGHNLPAGKCKTEK